VELGILGFLVWELVLETEMLLVAALMKVWVLGLLLVEV
jgi:hypothetical protein